MSPSETSKTDGFLERPEEALEFYRRASVDTVVCEEKHMGSRSVVVIARDEEAASKRFGVDNEGRGAAYTRTGRRFFADAALESAVLNRLGSAIDRSGLWEELATDWVCLDCEIMPWSAKAGDLLRTQYAPTGAAGQAAVAAAQTLLRQGMERGLDLGGLAQSFEDRRSAVDRYVAAYRHYCWPVRGIEDIRMAPFHLLATEGAVHVDKNHVWHMEALRRLSAQDATFIVATPFRIARLSDAQQTRAIVEWWEELTSAGGEGMVVKPLDFVAAGSRGLIQPAIKSRGPEYLRIIYGPEYSRPEFISRLRERKLSTKRGMAIREFALGIEGLERFVRREPLRRVHECVFGVLALESEPVDPMVVPDGRGMRFRVPKACRHS
jgi:protein phosphatase